ncbi:ATP-grasp fold- subdomain 1 [Apiospora kogelbergensis]|uniref:ATP-grasp fold- subdomain 1 n=1 Tax=Apiospora kogelbergensis TaxID=1337665 RepID=UPI003132546F
MGIEDKKAFVDSYDPAGRNSDDIVVQEYIDGRDFTCSVIEVGDGCITLAPYVYKTNEVQMKEKLLTFELKFDGKTCIEQLQKKPDPELFERLQQVAIEAFVASGCKGSNMGCEVHLRARPDGKVFAIDVNPKPATFAPEGEFQDLPIIHSLPGGHPAVINIFIANHMLRNAMQGSVLEKVACAYDKVALQYSRDDKNNVITYACFRKLVNQFDFAGTVFDLACGTGSFGRILFESKGRASTRLIGFDISPRMLDICRSTGLYDATHIDSMESTLAYYHCYAKSVDHVVCFSAVHFLRSEMFAFVLVLCFTLANKSITISVDDIPDQYNENLKQRGYGFMYSTNHIANMKSFGEPPGWRLTKGERQYSWTSPATGDDVYTTYFRFDRIPDASRHLMFSTIEVLN